MYFAKYLDCNGTLPILAKEQKVAQQHYINIRAEQINN